MKKTKIICTLGPATDNPQTLEKMIEAGMDVARFNFSHGAYEDHEKRLKEVLAVREKLNAPVATLLDTKGPEVRLGDFENPDGVTINHGDKFTLTTKKCMGNEKKSYVNYEGLPNDVKPGTVILINDGIISMKVDSVKGTDIHCTVIDGGLLTNHKGVNVPGVDLNMPYLSERDMNDLKFGAAHDFDFIAASFVRSATDVTILRNFVEAIGWKDVKIISKIENTQGVDNIDDIIAASDGIMVARGDMGVEIDFQRIPAIQKMIIRKVYDAGKIVVTATQMLESMITNPRPTRAEANDVANAIFDGTDAIMLSGETANGAFPTEAVQIMAKIAETTENSMDYSRNLKNNFNGMHKNMTNAISYAACTTAAELNTSCIATVTKTGLTAKMIAKYKPVCPIAASSSSERVWRQLNLVWGCKPVLEKEIADNNKVFDLALSTAVKSGLAQNGDTVVIAIGVPVGVSGSTNTLRIDIVGNVICKGTGIGGRCVSGKAAVIKYSGEAEKKFKTGDILVTKKVDNSVLPYIKRASALVIGPVEKSQYENAELISNILEIPVIMCEINVTDLIKHETLITVDAKKGFIYFGMPEKK
ncbi:MAG: pyruvate kinase [Eubacteriales bacterium]|nr:pyruvate kinase [Eubacteriales bacterium]